MRTERRWKSADREEREAQRAADGFQAAVTQAESDARSAAHHAGRGEFVDRVAPLLSDKPRALKRFVNTYRLLKASLSDVDRESFR